MPACQDCGRIHRTGAEAILCDYRMGRRSPGVSPAEQERIAHEIDPAAWRGEARERG